MGSGQKDENTRRWASKHEHGRPAWGGRAFSGTAGINEFAPYSGATVQSWLPGPCAYITLSAAIMES
jgi:hypothetical protein